MLDRKALIEETIHSVLRKFGYDGYVPADKVAYLAKAVDTAITEGKPPEDDDDN